MTFADWIIDLRFDTYAAILNAVIPIVSLQSLHLDALSAKTISGIISTSDALHHGYLTERILHAETLKEALRLLTKFSWRYGANYGLC